MAYGDFECLNRRTFSEKALLDKPFDIAKDQTYDWDQHRLVSISYKYFDKKNFW